VSWTLIHTKILLNQCVSEKQEANERPDIIAPLMVKTKGRLCQKRLASAVERANNSLKHTCLAEPDTASSEVATGSHKTANTRQTHHCCACGEVGHYTTTCSRRKGKD
jgi:hypothetical protein